MPRGIRRAGRRHPAPPPGCRGHARPATVGRSGATRSTARAAAARPAAGPPVPGEGRLAGACHRTAAHSSAGAAGVRVPCPPAGRPGPDPGPFACRRIEELRDEGTNAARGAPVAGWRGAPGVGPAAPPPGARHAEQAAGSRGALSVRAARKGEPREAVAGALRRTASHACLHPAALRPAASLGRGSAAEDVRRARVLAPPRDARHGRARATVRDRVVRRCDQRRPDRRARPPPAAAGIRPHAAPASRRLARSDRPPAAVRHGRVPAVWPLPAARGRLPAAVARDAGSGRGSPASAARAARRVPASSDGAPPVRDERACRRRVRSRPAGHQRSRCGPACCGRCSPGWHG